MDDLDQQEKRIFNDALEVDPGAAREAFLQGACAGDESLRGRVEALLEAFTAASGFLPQRTVEQTEILPAGRVTEGPGAVIGRYKLLEEIGEGGWGVVYMAEQQEPVRRKVALKIIKPGMDTRQVIARFEAERQALALMEHSNIAQVFDAGATETGRPYFVMELVRGIPITKFCDENRLTTRKRLELFVQVCRAIQHAHQKGIIHRDIKPSNILVTVNDGVPVPKVIDFGIAKATSDLRLTDKTLFTAFAQFIGTPAYMSPEQAVMTSLDIDTRSDIYALGVLLYELLTGQTPFDAKALLAAGLDAMRRTLREQDPVRPSTRLRAMAAGDLTHTARLRHADPPRLIHLLHGDLDRIAMKALEKDRNRRYESAHALADDVERHLRHEPILARPPTVRYLTGRFLRRHRSQIAVSAAGTVLVAGLVGAVWTYVRNLGVEKLRWAKGEALPQLVRLVEREDFRSAFDLAQKAKKYLPDDPTLAELWPRICQDYSILTTPPGAEIFCRVYSETGGPWQYLGRSPLSPITLPQGLYRWKIAKDGFATHECVADRSFEVRLQPQDPAGEMVWIGAFTAGLPSVPGGQVQTVEAPAYLIDQYEVTNEEYQAFVDAGGYDAPESWQGLEFRKDGRLLSWSEALAEFRDQTDQPGPAPWAGGTYPAGQGRHPVGGVSWFEAAAYARFVGKSLPTVTHWERAACLDESFVIIPFSNFGMEPLPVGTCRGMGHTGLYDMAGNVKEWCLNATDDSTELRYILGGGWGEPSYLSCVRDSRSPWKRSPQNGFRCVRLPGADESIGDALGQPLLMPKWRNVSSLVPFLDDEFAMLCEFYQYDAIPLNAVVESTEESSPFWRREDIRFDAACGREPVIAHLFLPRTGKPPYQTVIYFPGLNAMYERSFIGLPYREVTEYILMSGRALLFPVYYGMYERPPAWGQVWTPDRVAETPVAYRDWTILMAKDLMRSIDYLETRTDIDCGKIAYYGLSMGAVLGPIMLAVEDRISTGVFALGGIRPQELPRSFDMALYAERVKVPVLMVNGREDVLLPLEDSQIPLRDQLRKGSRDVEHKLYDGGHGVFGLFYKQIRQDVLDWLDLHLGPVE